MSNPYAPPDPERQADQGRDRAGRPDGEHDGEQAQGGQGAGGPAPGSGGQQPWRQQPSDGQRPAKGQQPWRQSPQPDPARQAATSRMVLRFGLLMLIAVLIMQMDLPWQLASLVFAGAALVVGVRALIRVIKDKLRGGIVVLLVFGLGLCGMLAVTALSSLAVWDEQMQRQDCLRSALTVSAQDRCEREFQQALEERLGEVP